MDKVEAMKILKDFHDKSALFSVRTALETLHPELAESEDEKTRKRIIALVNAHGQGMYKDDMLAWLEKQGKEDSFIQQAYEQGYTEGKRIERKHWIEKQNFSEDYNSIDPQFGKPIEQNPAEWSEEDKKIINGITSYLCTHDSCELDGFNKWYDWLKSLKERITWKPSDEQMKVLDSVIDEYDGYPEFDSLVSLKNDLRKL